MEQNFLGRIALQLISCLKEIRIFNSRLNNKPSSYVHRGFNVTYFFVHLFTLHIKLIILQKREFDWLIHWFQRVPFSDFFFQNPKRCRKGRLEKSHPKSYHILRHLLVQSQQWKHQNNVWNLFKVNSKDTRTTSLTSFWWLYY